MPVSRQLVFTVYDREMPVVKETNCLRSRCCIIGLIIFAVVVIVAAVLGSLFATKVIDVFTTSSVKSDSTWNEWGSWSECSKACGGGISVRERICSDGDGCVGDPDQSKLCADNDCALSWTDWSTWSDCSSTCGGGTQVRARACPTANQCGAEATSETKSCNSSCTWSAWSSWSQCSLICGGGTQTRTRSCPFTQLCGAGSSMETKSCRNTCEWNAWSSWSDCSVSCGSGTQSRTRSCPRANKCGYESTTNTKSCAKSCASCPSSWETSGDGCYKIVRADPKLEWGEARQKCRTHNPSSDLVVIQTLAKNNAIIRSVRKQLPEGAFPTFADIRAWIGGKAQAGGFTWITGQRMMAGVPPWQNALLVGQRSQWCASMLVNANFVQGTF